MDIEEMFYKYNEAAKDQGFKMNKNIRKQSSFIEVAVFYCQFA